MGPTPIGHPLKRRGMCDLGRTWLTSPGRTRWSVLLAATEPFSHMGESLCEGT